jgi:hypothetical protein
MNKSLILIIIISIFAFACQKENDTKTVTYFVKGFTNPYMVIYTYGDSIATKVDTIDPAGNGSYTWRYSFDAMPGEIAYIYVQSDEHIANLMNFNTSIIVDKKILQKAVSYDNTRVINGDTVSYIKRSCTIPF